MLTAADIAIVCHEANRAYCRALGDDSQLPWDVAPEWQRESALAGVRGIATGVITSPRQSHESWFALKWSQGWRYGHVKNPETKEHPCMLDYDQLPPAQRRKDALFFAIVTVLREPAR